MILVDNFAEKIAESEAMAHMINKELEGGFSDRISAMFSKSQLAVMLHVSHEHLLPLAFPRRPPLPRRTRAEIRNQRWLTRQLIQARERGHDNDADVLLDMLDRQGLASARRAYIREAAVAEARAKQLPDGITRFRSLYTAALARDCAARIPV